MLKATHLQLLEVCFIDDWFCHHLEIHFHALWSYEGQVKTPVIPTSCPGYALCSSVFWDRQNDTATDQLCPLYLQKSPAGTLASFYLCQMCCCLCVYKIFAFLTSQLASFRPTHLTVFKERYSLIYFIHLIGTSYFLFQGNINIRGEILCVSFFQITRFKGP